LFYSYDYFRDTDSEEDEDAEVIEDSSSVEEEEDFGKQPSKKRSPSPSKKQQSTPKKKRVIRVKTSSPEKAKATTVSSSRPLNRRGVQAAFFQLAKKVLDDETETPETSLVAALLHSCKPIPGFPNKEHALHEQSTQNSIYTLQLEAIARKYVQDSNPNALHCHLLNLIFRSVGGNLETNLDLETTTDLDDLDDSQWNDLISDVVQQMRETDANKTLLTAAPSKQAAVQEYRKVYCEFWYRLGKVILSGVSSSTSTSTSSEEPFTSSRFQVEMVRDIVTRITELVPVGQPDLRAAATMAVLQLAHACLERTVELEGKLVTAIRQHHAAAKSNGTRKLQMIQQSMDDWKRHKLELEELVVGPVLQGVFVHRYRDSNAFVRALCLEALSQMTTTRPDLFLMDKYLKYMGWMCSDKVASVRLAGLKGLTAPFLHYEQQQESAQPDNKLLAPLKIDLHQLENVCTKFLARFVDCTQDVDTDVQEQAMELLLHMLRNEFLDDWDVMEETAWDQVNLKALDIHATPKVRKNALYFILEQLDCFDNDDQRDEGTTSADVPEKKQMERVEGIASWYVYYLFRLFRRIASFSVAVTHSLLVVFLAFAGLPTSCAMETFPLTRFGCLSQTW
jgi:cohesin complex subunit SA-1/2